MKMTCETSAINTSIIRILTEIVIVSPCFHQWTITDSNYSDWLCDVLVCALLQREVMIFVQLQVKYMQDVSPQSSALLILFAFSFPNFSSRVTQREVKSISFSKYHSHYMWNVHLYSTKESEISFWEFPFGNLQKNSDSQDVTFT